MSRSIPPEELQLLMAGYVLNDLTDEEAAVVETLLVNPEMTQAIAQMQSTLEQVYSPPEVQPPPHLRDAVLKAFHATTPNSALTPSTPPLSEVAPVAVLPRWAKALGAIAALLIVSLSVSNYWLWRSLQMRIAQNQPIEPVSEILVFSLQPTPSLETPAEVVVRVNPETLQGTLTVENLPPLAPGKVYVLWTVVDPDAPFTTDPKNAILTQVFTVDHPDDQTQAIILPRAFQEPDVVRAIAITVEDATAPQQHKSAPILIEQL